MARYLCITKLKAWFVDSNLERQAQIWIEHSTLSTVVARLLCEDPPERAIRILDIWVNNKRFLEVSYKTIDEINELLDHDALSALLELKRLKTYICGTKGNQLDVDNVLTLDMGINVLANTLVDSSCTGACIVHGFVEAKGINTRAVA
ncbi:hypothetical protein L218DRAFT_883018 [Marasmius fiardii PR-910]|nr:hypothetical protein L218DRAFT_883018 [Marasmius fiardii PR-910]